MDQFLYNYLLSGEAWLLVGSGPSIEMGYPTWAKLANLSVETIKADRLKADISRLDTLLANRNYPEVFTLAKKALGDQRLRQVLRDNLKPTKTSVIYEIIAKWPIPVYMTTNYDDELQAHLASLGLTYTPLSNSEDHLSLLVSDSSNSIVKLHGDLSQGKGLILTKEDYKEVKESPNWGYWRKKLASIFQMNRIIVIGYSLSDSNVRVVLEASREGTGVTQPIIWIASDVSTADQIKLLNEYRIRVISYDNKDGQHRNLVRLLQSIKDAVPPRTIVKIQEEIDKASRPMEPNVAAAGFFVFNEFCKQKDFNEKRMNIILGAIQASLPTLEKLPKFSFDFALETSGWTEGVDIDPIFKSQIVAKALKQGLLVREGSEFKVSENAVKNASDKRAEFERMRELFKQSLRLRINRDFSELIGKQVGLLSEDIESSLIRYFRDGGLSLASLLFSKGQQKIIPGSLFAFAASSSTRYDNMTLRLAFFKTSIDSGLCT